MKGIVNVVLVLLKYVATSYGQALFENAATVDRSSAKRTDANDALCHGKFDIVFLADMSGSVKDAYEEQRKLMLDIVDSLRVAPNAARVAVVQFSGYPTVEFPLNAFASQSEIAEQIRAMFYRGGVTRAGLALESAEHVLFDAERRDAEKIVLLMSDGLSIDNPEPIAARLRDRGVRIFAISVADDAYVPEMREIAGSDLRVYLHDRFKKLPAELHAELVKSTTTQCNGKSDDLSTTTAAVTKMLMINATTDEADEEIDNATESTPAATTSIGRTTTEEGDDVDELGVPEPANTTRSSTTPKPDTRRDVHLDRLIDLTLTYAAKVGGDPKSYHVNETRKILAQALTAALKEPFLAEALADKKARVDFPTHNATVYLTEEEATHAGIILTLLKALKRNETTVENVIPLLVTATAQAANKSVGASTATVQRIGASTTMVEVTNQRIAESTTNQTIAESTTNQAIFESTTNQPITESTTTVQVSNQSITESTMTVHEIGTSTTSVEVTNPSIGTIAVTPTTEEIELSENLSSENSSSMTSTMSSNSSSTVDPDDSTESASTNATEADVESNVTATTEIDVDELIKPHHLRNFTIPANTTDNDMEYVDEEEETTTTVRPSTTTNSSLVVNTTTVDDDDEDDDNETETDSARFSIDGSVHRGEVDVSVSSIRKKRRNCPYDILFLLDSSTSVSERYDIHKLFLKKLVRSARPGPPVQRFALYQFAGRDFQRLEFTFDTHQTSGAVLGAIDGLELLTGTTHIGKVLHSAVRLLNARRADAASMVVLLTDGFSGDDGFRNAAYIRRRLRVPIFAVGFGEQNDRESLTHLTGDRRKVFLGVDEAKKFQKIFHALMHNC